MYKLAVFFPIYPFYEYHLSKDVGLFPKYFYKVYFDSIELLITGKEKNVNIKCDFAEIKNLHIDPKIYENKYRLTLKHQIKCFFKSFFYLLRNRNISHIQLYHILQYTIYLGTIIKLFFPHIKLYIKMDTAVDGALYLDNLLNEPSITTKIKRWLFSKVELISIETSEAFNILSKNPWMKNFKLIPNGYDNDLSNIIPENIPSRKDNIIITVGRLGSYQKNTEILLEIFSEIELYDWKVYLIGPLEIQEKDFGRDVAEFFLKNKKLKNSVFFTKNISDKSLLYKFYEKAKVFICSSRFESFGIAVLEAAVFGDYIISTNVGAAYDLTNAGKYGYICPANPESGQDRQILKEKLKNHLQKIINNEIDLKDICMQQSQFIVANYNMHTIISSKSFLEWAS